MVDPQNKKELNEIIARYLSGSATPEEIRFLEIYYDYAHDRSEQEDAGIAPRRLKQRMMKRIVRQIQFTEHPQGIVRRIRPAHWAWAVAALFILFAGGAYLWHLPKSGLQNRISPSLSFQPAIVPGGNRAVLTLSGGKQIILDSAHSGTISRQGNTTITNVNGQLAYNNLHGKDAGQTWNTLLTPRGGQYQIVLPDGTRVWLNAASSLYYPTAFSDAQREVRLEGEAYFEVAKDHKRPFRVRAGEMRVQVLGTSFNINAYADEQVIKASLLEGSVKISQRGDSGILKPGQQAVLGSGSAKIQIADADMEEAIAWKNGLFQFEGADITSVMRQIGRWYDLEIEYAGKIPEQKFEGKISRNSALADVLKILELSKVKFSILGKKLIVQ